MDINESKVAEDKLQKSERHYRNIFNKSLIGIYQTTPRGDILKANPAIIKMVGFDSLSELNERNIETENDFIKSTRNNFIEIKLYFKSQMKIFVFR